MIHPGYVYNIAWIQPKSTHQGVVRLFTRLGEYLNSVLNQGATNHFITHEASVEWSKVIKYDSPVYIAFVSMVA